MVRHDGRGSGRNVTIRTDPSFEAIRRVRAGRTRAAEVQLCKDALGFPGDLHSSTVAADLFHSELACSRVIKEHERGVAACAGIGSGIAGGADAIAILDRSDRCHRHASEPHHSGELLRLVYDAPAVVETLATQTKIIER